MKTFVVLGAGRFGSSLAKALFDFGFEVLVIDKNEDVISDISNHVTHAVIGDCADEAVLKSLGVRNFDVGVVAVGEDMESSILTTLLLKEMGLKYILAKAQSDLHSKVLLKVGADKVIFPERDMGIKIARSLADNNILDYIELSPKHSIVELAVPADWVGKSLKALNVRANYGITIMAIKTKNGIEIAPSGERLLKEDDIMVVLGANADLEKIR